MTDFRQGDGDFKPFGVHLGHGNVVPCACQYRIILRYSFNYFISGCFDITEGCSQPGAAGNGLGQIKEKGDGVSAEFDATASGIGSLCEMRTCHGLILKKKKIICFDVSAR